MTWSVKGAGLNACSHCPFPAPHAPTPGINPVLVKPPQSLHTWTRICVRCLEGKQLCRSSPHPCEARLGVVWPFSRGLITNGSAFSLRAVVICDCSNIQPQSASHRGFITQGHREQQPHAGRPALSLASVNLSPRFQSSNTKLPMCSPVQKRDVMFTPNSARAQTIVFYGDDLF